MALKDFIKREYKDDFNAFVNSKPEEFVNDIFFVNFFGFYSLMAKFMDNAKIKSYMKKSLQEVKSGKEETDFALAYKIWKTKYIVARYGYEDFYKEMMNDLKRGEVYLRDNHWRDIEVAYKTKMKPSQRIRKIIDALLKKEITLYHLICLFVPIIQRNKNVYEDLYTFVKLLKIQPLKLSELIRDEEEKETRVQEKEDFKTYRDVFNYFQNDSDKGLICKYCLDLLNPKISLKDAKYKISSLYMKATDVFQYLLKDYTTPEKIDKIRDDYIYDLLSRNFWRLVNLSKADKEKLYYLFGFALPLKNDVKIDKQFLMKYIVGSISERTLKQYLIGLVAFAKKRGERLGIKDFSFYEFTNFSYTRREEIEKIISSMKRTLPDRVIIYLNLCFLETVKSKIGKFREREWNILLKWFEQFRFSEYKTEVLSLFKDKIQIVNDSLEAEKFIKKAKGLDEELFNQIFIEGISTEEIEGEEFSIVIERVRRNKRLERDFLIDALSSSIFENGEEYGRLFAYIKSALFDKDLIEIPLTKSSGFKKSFFEGLSDEIVYYANSEVIQNLTTPKTKYAREYYYSIIDFVSNLSQDAKKILYAHSSDKMLSRYIVYFFLDESKASEIIKTKFDIQDVLNCAMFTAELELNPKQLKRLIPYLKENLIQSGVIRASSEECVKLYTYLFANQSEFTKEEYFWLLGLAFGKYSEEKSSFEKFLISAVVNFMNFSGTHDVLKVFEKDKYLKEIFEKYVETIDDLPENIQFPSYVYDKFFKDKKSILKWCEEKSEKGTFIGKGIAAYATVSYLIKNDATITEFKKFIKIVKKSETPPLSYLPVILNHLLEEPKKLEKIVKELPEEAIEAYFYFEFDIKPKSGYIYSMNPSGEDFQKFTSVIFNDMKKYENVLKNLFDKIQDRKVINQIFTQYLFLYLKKEALKPEKSKGLIVLSMNDEMLKAAMKFNDIKIPRLRRKKNESLGEFFLRLREKMTDLEEIIPEPKIEPVEMDEEGLLRETLYLNQFLSYPPRHGNIAPRVLKVWNAKIEFPEFYEFAKEYPDKILKPVFHGTGTLAAAFILRYGFKITRGKLIKAGRMLGDGIYFSNVIDKVSQYVGDFGFTRWWGTKGYIFEMEAILGKKHEHYMSAGLGNDGILSPEWCVFYPEKQLRIYKVYYVELIQRKEIEMLLKKHNVEIIERQRKRRRK